MTKLELAKAELDRLKVFEEYKNSTMMKMVAILGKDIPFEMSSSISNFTMASFIGHFHYKLQLCDIRLTLFRFCVLCKEGITSKMLFPLSLMLLYCVRIMLSASRQQLFKKRMLLLHYVYCVF